MTALGVVDEAGLTQTGHVRRNNEDSYLIRGDLFMIADGMGGAAAGEVASAMCAQAFAEIDLIRNRGDGALRDAIVVANTRIHERATSDPAASGMGTTVTAALVESDGRVALANVGDSRAYLLREGALRRLTEDHSVVAELVATGQISDWEASSHPQRNVVTRVLGAEATVQVDTFWLEAQDGDVVLLCSDGLTDMVAEEEFAKLLAADKSCEQIARDLVRAALAQGGEDNVTTVLFRIGPSRAQEAAQPRTVLTQDPDLEPVDDGGRSRKRTALRVMTTLGVIAILGAGSIYFLRWAHFVGADESSGHVAVYQGLPIDLFGGVKLYHEVSDTHIAYAALNQATREKLFDHTIRSDASARSVAESAGSSGP
ncbi:MAG TPA: Stp1/IreP family PP2C-type Ser/Thr phosphatase [Gaiellales bacterium]|nr:Stp1/IreP family PP2C-type Ser/Thr phosphatase [Gaiellales bacterium]